jgi:hypothetical protein
MTGRVSRINIYGFFDPRWLAARTVGILCSAGFRDEAAVWVVNDGWMGLACQDDSLRG